MQVSKPDQYTLVVTKSRLGSILYIIFCLSVTFYLFYALDSLFEGVRFRDDVLDYLYKNPVYGFILLLPIPIIQKISKSISTIITGEEYIFNGLTKTVLKNKKLYVSFSEIAHLEIRTPFFGTHIGHIREHILQVRLQSLKKFEIHTSYNLSEISDLADDIGNLIGVGVVRTEL